MKFSDKAKLAVLILFAIWTTSIALLVIWTLINVIISVY